MVVRMNAGVADSSAAGVATATRSLDAQLRTLGKAGASVFLHASLTTLLNMGGKHVLKLLRGKAPLLRRFRASEQPPQYT